MQPQNKPLKRRKYDAIFKADVLKMIANGQSVAYVAQALGISEALIYKWKQRNKGEEKHPLWVGSLTPYSITNACYSVSVN